MWRNRLANSSPECAMPDWAERTALGDILETELPYGLTAASFPGWFEV
jgi:hypothetical protein